MHLLILADAVDTQKAGVHTYTIKLIENLLKLAPQNTYSFIHESKNKFFDELKNEFKNSNHYIIPRKKIPGYNSFRKFYLIPKLIKELKPDIVFETSHIGPFNLPKAIKRALIVHDLTPILYPKFHILNSTLIHKLLFKRILKKADLIITTSKTTKQDIHNYTQTKAIFSTTPLGVGAPNQTTEQNSRTELTTNYTISTPYFLYLGTLEPRKNLETLAEAFLELKQELNLPHKLILAGQKGWKIQKFLQKIDNNPDIIITGHVDEKTKSTLYKNAEIFIYPSFYEGFGLPPLEAMSHGVPVICSNKGSLKELYQNHALTFAPTDKAALKAKIQGILTNQNLRDQLVKRGLQYSQNFTWQKTAQKTIAALNELILDSSQKN
ncbi:MAG: glycosyltransferase family 1 protein [Patescibacteria group bacterium]